MNLDWRCGLLALCLSLTAPTSTAQTDPSAPADRKESKAEPERSDPPAPADRDFKPSEEVSPDQEVDFPADL